MKKICWWLGTDALTLVKNPPGNRIWHLKLKLYRMKWMILKRFFTHWAVHENLNVYLKQFGIFAKIVVDPPMYPEKVSKIKHDGFNILYYRPHPANLGGQKYINRYYGYDIYQRVKEYFKDKDIRFKEVDGTEDLSKVYPYTDAYIRPNHWDGMPRMVLECQINEIPYYWCSEMKGDYLNPKLEECIKFIQHEYSREVRA